MYIGTDVSKDETKNNRNFGLCLVGGQSSLTRGTSHVEIHTKMEGSRMSEASKMVMFRSISVIVHTSSRPQPTPISPVSP